MANLSTTIALVILPVSLPFFSVSHSISRSSLLAVCLTFEPVVSTDKSLLDCTPVPRICRLPLLEDKVNYLC